jgi:transcriptional regulator with XRE-family HTH domain
MESWLRESDKRGSELADFLKFLRRRIDPDVRVLGPHVRLPQRVGKRVTQEELAEAIEVGREWYVQLERGTARTRASTGSLHRLADALMITQEERVRLFQLALPDVGRLQLRDDSIAALEAFSGLRLLTKRLWTATSVEDVLTTAGEQIGDWFDGALLVSSTRRRHAGLWESRFLDDKQERNAVSKVIGDVKELLPTSASFDALGLYPQLANAGDVGSPELWPVAIQREMLKACARRRVAGFAGLYARVRSRTGFIGGLVISHEFGYSYSASDRAVFGAFAELTSFALS